MRTAGSVTPIAKATCESYDSQAGGLGPPRTGEMTTVGIFPLHAKELPMAGPRLSPRFASAAAA